jgi:hypothetical protein
MSETGQGAKPAALEDVAATAARYRANLQGEVDGTSLFTGRGLMFSGLRQLVIGLVAAGVTYGIGRAIGVSLGG